MLNGYRDRHRVKISKQLVKYRKASSICKKKGHDWDFRTVNATYCIRCNDLLAPL